MHAGCPDYLSLIIPRAEASSIPVEPPYFPKSFLEFVKTHDPTATPHTADQMDANPFRGKKILVVSGKEDELVPWTASKEFVDTLDVGEEGVKEVFVEPGVGHTCSPKMIKETVKCLWEQVLTKTSADARAASL